MHHALTKTDHRPWPIPQQRWTWRQSWRDLLFAHWPIDTDVIRPLVPPELTIQEFDGTSWIGIVPFRMAGVMRRPLPDLPWVSAFPELNVRVYVEYEGKPGVWFLSLDATNPLAIWGAKTFFHLPYHRASMTVTPTARANSEPGVEYSSVRSEGDAVFEASYRPTSDPYAASPGTLEHWLTERYCLYAKSRRGNLFRGEVHHHPWPLQSADATIMQNTMTAPHGIALDGPPQHLHFARRIDVVVWSLTRLA